MRIRIIRVLLVYAVLAGALTIGPAFADASEAFAYYQADVAKIRELFEGRKFSELTALLEGYQTSCEKDIRWEIAVTDGISFFDVAVPAYKARIEEWCEAIPGSWVPILARATYYNAIGWKARGTAWAKDTSGEQIRRMEENLIVAAMDVERALKINPRLFFAHVLLMQINQSRGDQEIGKLLVQSALKECPDSYMIRYGHMNILRPRWGGSYDAMTEFAMKSAPAGDKNPLIKTLPGMVYWDMATLAQGNGNYDEAIELYEQALAFGETFSVLNDLANCYLRARMDEKALAASGRAIALRPNLAGGYGTMAKILFFQEKPNAAIECLQKMEQVGGRGADESADIRKWAGEKIVNTAHSMFRERSYTKAIEAYDLALRIDPENADAFCWRGIAFKQTGNAAKAQDDLRKAVLLNPRLYEAYVGLDELLIREGKLDEIIGLWDRFIKLEPGNANAYLERGGTYFRKGDRASALKDATRACELGNAEACRRAQSLQR